MKRGVQRVGLLEQKVPEAVLEIRLNRSVRSSLRMRYKIAILMKVKKRESPVARMNYYFGWSSLRLGVV